MLIQHLKKVLRMNKFTPNKQLHSDALTARLCARREEAYHFINTEILVKIIIH